MMKIQHPLPAPTPAQIELAKTDADARKRVRNQMLRAKRREEEIGVRLGVAGRCLWLWRRRARDPAHPLARRGLWARTCALWCGLVPGSYGMAKARTAIVCRMFGSAEA
jgi:hypothetical protein